MPDVQFVAHPILKGRVVKLLARSGSVGSVLSSFVQSPPQGTDRELLSP